jgi:hypothetical protein
VLEPEALQAAFLASAGEVQAMVNHLGLAARSAPTAKLVFDSDLRASLRRALQFGRTELVSVETSLGPQAPLLEPTDIVVAGRARAYQLAIELRWHPRGEDHVGFANGTMWDITKMVTARSRGAVEQATVLIAAPSRFWRWLQGYADDRPGYDLLNSTSDTPASVKSDFLTGPTWQPIFDESLPDELPERLWSSLLDAVELRSPWGETELRLLEVKGLGQARALR